MDVRLARVVHVLIILLAFSAPVLAALYMAARQSYDEQADLASTYADDVLRRADDTAIQIARAFAALRAIPREQACSDRSIALMARLHIPADRLQTVGFVDHGRLMCSSLGHHGQGLPLPPMSYLSTAGNEIRPDVMMPWSSDQAFLFVTDHETGFTAVVHPIIPVDVDEAVKGLTVGVFGISSGERMVGHGDFSDDWFRVDRASGGEPFVLGDHLIAVRRSRHDYAAYAALPYTRVNQVLLEKSLVLVPIAMAGGVAIAFLGVHVARRQAEIPAQIRTALSRHEFHLAYQPIVRLSDGRCVGAEALVRWQRRSGELVRPDLFIPVAEDTGLIRLVTRRVLELAARDAGNLFAEHPDFHLAINLSSADLHETATLSMIDDAALKMGARRGNLVVEATERGFIHAGVADAIIAGLRERGVLVAIDDFGTGYSSLARLQSLPLDYLKIDKCFVDTIGRGAATSHVALHIIEMAKDLGLAMIAEGVENAAQAEFLRARGVELAQGWHFGKAGTMAQLRARLAAERDPAPSPQAATA